ncbi:YsnF/AvaK domain-containing protein [Neobacillus sp. DY30]|uniref:YsnF/AvaK domain-containing protein n=1 Tax=Neobacillus sp. DY30 TaxID=3047871 RepID=UPI0024BF1E2F|nr:YsnF/AvaK domain-containing protein [Neobacillus sp. DY30]WHY02556.1 YsnF/AvaK domain-containing protein [Neobacillus sp. DY30]
MVSEQSEKANIHNDDLTIKLHKEELQVSKKWIDTANVTVYKKIYTEEKQISVPVRREELIIEKKVVNSDGATNNDIETICIPIREDRIEVTLHPTLLEDVEIYKNQYEEIKEVIETLQEEKVHIETIGDIKVTVNNPLSTT